MGTTPERLSLAKPESQARKSARRLSQGKKTYTIRDSKEQLLVQSSSPIFETFDARPTDYVFDFSDSALRETATQWIDFLANRLLLRVCGSRIHPKLNAVYPNVILIRSPIEVDGQYLQRKKTFDDTLGANGFIMRRDPSQRDTYVQVGPSVWYPSRDCLSPPSKVQYKR